MNNEISVKDLISSIKKKGLLQSIPQLEQIYQLAIEVEKKLAESEAKCVHLAAENVQIKAMNDCLSEELRGYESDGAFEGPKMHLLWWQVETPATDRIVAGIKADGAKAAGDYLKLEAQHMPVVERLMMQDAAEICYGTAARLREGADK